MSTTLALVDARGDTKYAFLFQSAVRADLAAKVARMGLTEGKPRLQIFAEDAKALPALVDATGITGVELRPQAPARHWVRDGRAMALGRDA